MKHLNKLADKNYEYLKLKYNSVTDVLRSLIERTEQYYLGLGAHEKLRNLDKRFGQRYGFQFSFILDVCFFLLVSFCCSDFLSFSVDTFYVFEHSNFDLP